MNPDTPLSPELLALFKSSPPLTASQRDRIAKAAEKLDEDPAFRAEVMKGRFVAHIHEAMEEQGISQSDLARRWGKSRQYLSRVLNEDRRVNFTIETMVELADLVGRKLETLVLNPNENTHVLRCKVPPRTVVPADFFEEPARSAPANVCAGGFRTVATFKGTLHHEKRLSA